MAEQQEPKPVAKDYSNLRVGQTVRVSQKIKEGEKTRTQVYEGIIIARAGKTPATKTITVRKVSEGIGVERIFPLASPLIENIEIRKIAQVRRAKLFYLRHYKKPLTEKIVAAA